MRFYTQEDIESFEAVRFLFIKTALTGHIFRIMLNRPEKRNAFTAVMAEEIIFALAYAHYHSEVRCIILDAKGPVFCAGADLYSFHEAVVLKNETLPEIRDEARLGDAFAQLYKPSIAQIEGSVFAGGFLLICGCTFVISVGEAMFSLPEVKRGIWPMQVMASLLPIVPKRKILEMSITGWKYTAEQALALGLVTKIVSKEEIGKVVNELAAEICQNAPYAIRLGMESLNALSDIRESDQHTFLKSQLDKLLSTEDAKEGSVAFKEKRNPIWKSR